MRDISVLIAGRSREAIDGIAAILRDCSGLAVQLRHVNNGHVDPLYGAPSKPDLLIVLLSPMWEDELRALTARPARERPATIAVGSESDARMMRLAMQAGMRDFFTHPVVAEEMISAVMQVAGELTVRDRSGQGQLTAFINAKGGSGASCLACNAAHILTARFRQRTLLIDLDLQFGTLPVYLDLKPRDSILDALEANESLDAVALEGHTARHASGLRLLAASADRLALPWEVPRDKLGKLIEVALSYYDQVVVDLPRQMDPLTAAALTRADRVCIVMQQELTHLRDATRLAGILKGDLSVPENHIDLIVNRYDPGHSVRAQDIREAVKVAGLYTVPSDYRTVSESVNLGTPLLDHASSASITQALVEIVQRMSGAEEAPAKSRLQSVVSRFLTKHTGARI